jgi:predicted amidohydrolase YtcJ
MPPGAWIKIGGGWTELQFPEKRGPTVAELVAAAPDRPVYVQRLYNTAWITPAGMKLMNLTPATQIPGGKAERDEAGNLTGVFTGVNATFNFFTAKIPGPRIEEQYAGTKKYFRELNRLGMTAINDYPGGGMRPEHFNAVQQLWQKGEQTLRVTFHISGDSLAEYKALTAFTPMNFGDDWLHFRGIGESLTRGMYDGSTVGLPYNPSDKDRAEFCEVAKWAAEQDMNVHQHAASDRAASMILDCFEAVNKVLPIAGLRWQIAHLENASETTLARMKALNMGWAVQDRLVYSGGIVGKVLGPEGSKRAPPHRDGAEDGAARLGRHRLGSGRAVQPVHLVALAARRQGDRRYAHARPGRVAVARAGAADVFGELRLVHLRRGHSRHPRARQICRSRRALRRLHDGAGGEGRRTHIGAYRGRRQGRLRRRPLRRTRRETVSGGHQLAVRRAD